MEKKEEVKNGAPPVVMVEVVENEEEKQKHQQEIEFISHAADHDLNEKIARLRRQITSSITLKLPDKGAKIRRSLKFCEEELERRIQLRPQKEADCENTKQSQSSSPQAPSQLLDQKSTRVFLTDQGACNCLSSEAPSSQAQLESKITLPLFQNLGEKPNLSPRISVNPSHNLGRGNHQNTKADRPSLNQGRWEIKATSRQLPFRCHRNYNHDGNGRRSPIGATDSSNRYLPRQYGNVYQHSPMRPNQSEMRIPSLHNFGIQRILRSILQKPSTFRRRPQFPNTYRVNSRGPSEAQMEELLSSVHVMQKQFQTVQTQLTSLESQVTTRMDRLETKVELIIRGQTGDKSTDISTPERRDSPDSQVTTRMDRMETKVELIIRGQIVDKRSDVSTPERHDTFDSHVTSGMDIETKVEQIIQGQTGDKSTALTPERHETSDSWAICDTIYM